MKKSLLILGSLLFLGQPVMAKMETITDVLGRQVQVDIPVQRPIVTFYYPDYIAAVGANNFAKVVGISREFWEKFNPGSWKLFTEKIPDLKNINDVGNVSTNTFSTEKALALKPDAIIMADWQYKALASEIPKFQAVGVPIIVVDFNAQTVEKHTASIRLFGKLNGTQDRAEELAKAYQQGIADIQARIQEAHLPKPKIYVEFGDKGPAEYSYTFGKNMWGAIVAEVGGDNISAPFIKNWGSINPEQFLASKPDVVIISGTEVGIKENPTRMAMGIDVGEEEAQKRLLGYTQRPGWDSVPAVKNHRVYGIYHTASRSISDLASAQFIAKALYPTVFADVNPLKTYMDFHKKYLPIVPTGTFFIQLKN